jgi:hypothetical protein
VDHAQARPRDFAARTLGCSSTCPSPSG